MQTFDRADFLTAMNRLDAYYRAAEGLQRPAGLSIGGAPDFTGIAAWIFDVYLTCRAGGRSRDDAFAEVVAHITQSDEWKAKHPGQASTSPRGCTSPVRLDRAEFLQAMQRLDAFYRDVDGLQRPNGLSIAGRPDFEGIAAWIFDVYLNARLAGRSIEAAWTDVVRNIRASEEWITKHPEGPPILRFAVIGDYGLAGTPARDVAALVEGWGVDLVLTVGDNNYPAGAAATIDANVGQYYSSFIFPYVGGFRPGGTRNRFFPTLGNHDWETAGAAPYLGYFTLPGKERYYEFVEGPAHFFAIDSDPHEPDGVTAGSTQGQWLRQRLAASSAPLRVVYFHHAPFSSGQNGPTVTARWPYAEWGASVVLTGHEHAYERLVIDGFPYIVAGSGGHSLYTFGAPVAGSVVRYNGDFGAVLAEVDRAGVTFRFVTRSGVVVDTHRVPNRPGPGGARKRGRAY